MNHRDLIKKIIATWLANEGEVPDILDDATDLEAQEWTLLVEEVINEADAKKDEDENGET